MTKPDHPSGRLFLPVGRRLMALTCAYLTGIYLTHAVILPAVFSGILCAFLSVWAAYRLMRRKSALFCLFLVFAILGNLRAGNVLRMRDEPTLPGVEISGIVSEIEKPYRVYLEHVAVGESSHLPERRVLVTLMLEKDENGNVIDTAAPVLIGQRISGTGRLFAPEEKRNPGGVDRRISALCDGYELSGYILPGWTAEGAERFSVRELFRRMRETLIAHIDRLFGEQASVFAGIMLGDKSGVDDELMAAMRLTGTVHILTVSGMHMSLIGLLISRALRRLPIGRYLRFASFGILLSAFALLTGCAAGTVRALLMTLLREWAHLRGRRYEPLTGLSFAALAMSCVNPVWPLDASFQFSFFIVLGILLLAPTFGFHEGRRSRCPLVLRRVIGMISVSLSAQIASIPMQLLFYGYIPLLSLPMNLLCSMAMPLLMLGGWLNTVLGALWLDAGISAGRGLSFAASLFGSVSEWAAAHDGSILRLPAPYGIMVFVFAALMALLSRRIAFGRMRMRAASVLALSFVVLYVPRFCPAPRYVQLDVGQGDAALMRNGRRAVLVDIGPADSYDALRYLRSEGLFVDALILSHLDEDHAGALGVLLDSEVDLPAVILADGALGEALLDEKTEERDEISLAVLDALSRLDEQGVRLETVAAGDHIRVNGIDFDVLCPPRGEWREGDNEGSLLLYAGMEGVSFLLTGDLPVSSEPAFVPDCDVLKAAHHGSKNATSPAFLAMAKPEATLISAGEGNYYGHPHDRVLADLRAVGSEILRTDEQGCITLWLHDGKWYAETFLDK